MSGTRCKDYCVLVFFNSCTSSLLADIFFALLINSFIVNSAVEMQQATNFNCIFVLFFCLFVFAFDLHLIHSQFLPLRRNHVWEMLSLSRLFWWLVLLHVSIFPNRSDWQWLTSPLALLVLDIKWYFYPRLPLERGRQTSAGLPAIELGEEKTRRIEHV